MVASSSDPIGRIVARSDGNYLSLLDVNREYLKKVVENTEMAKFRVCYSFLFLMLIALTRLF